MPRLNTGDGKGRPGAGHRSRWAVRSTAVRCFQFTLWGRMPAAMAANCALRVRASCSAASHAFASLRAVAATTAGLGAAGRACGSRETAGS